MSNECKNLANEILIDIDKLNEKIRKANEETALSISLTIIEAMSMFSVFPVIQPRISETHNTEPLLPNTKCGIDRHFGFYLESLKKGDKRLSG